jgi:hypothetical protein
MMNASRRAEASLYRTAIQMAEMHGETELRRTGNRDYD